MKEIPDNIKEELEIHPVRYIDDVFKIALQKIPQPLAQDEGGDPVVSRKEKRDSCSRKKKH